MHGSFVQVKRNLRFIVSLTVSHTGVKTASRIYDGRLLAPVTGPAPGPAQQAAYGEIDGTEQRNKAEEG